MAVYLFKSTDAGAPAVTNAAGDLTALLDAILVDGYNSQTITITRTGDIATATCVGHGFVDKSRLLIADADQAEYNGEFRITWVDADTFTFTVTGSPTTPATGTITAKVAPLGWTTAFTDTSKRAYRQKAGTNQFYLRVDDTGTSSTRVVGYESMSDIDTGTNAFPTEVIFSGGLHAPKSNSGTARAWFVYSNGAKFYYMIKRDGTYYNGFVFGDFPSQVPGDVYNCLLIAGSSVTEYKNMWSVGSNLYQPGFSSHAFARNKNGDAGSQKFSKVVHFATSAATETNGIIGGHGMYNLAPHPIAYPDASTGGLKMSRIGLSSPVTGEGFRGRMSGLWCSMHRHALTHLDTFSGRAGTPLDGREFEVIKLLGDGNYSGDAVFEISDTWD